MAVTSWGWAQRLDAIRARSEFLEANQAGAKVGAGIGATAGAVGTGVATIAVAAAAAPAAASAEAAGAVIMAGGGAAAAGYKIGHAAGAHAQEKILKNLFVSAIDLGQFVGSYVGAWAQEAGRTIVEEIRYR